MVDLSLYVRQLHPSTDGRYGSTNVSPGSRYGANGQDNVPRHSAAYAQGYSEINSLSYSYRDGVDRNGSAVGSGAAGRYGEATSLSSPPSFLKTPLRSALKSSGSNGALDSLGGSRLYSGQKGGTDTTPLAKEVIRLQAELSVEVRIGRWYGACL